MTRVDEKPLLNSRVRTDHVYISGFKPWLLSNSNEGRGHWGNGSCLHERRQLYPLLNILVLWGIQQSRQGRTIRDPENHEAPFYKARLCVRGDQETDLLDTEDVFASVVRTEKLKLLLTLISTFSWHYLTLYVSSARRSQERCVHTYNPSKDYSELAEAPISIHRVVSQLLLVIVIEVKH